MISVDFAGTGWFSPRLSRFASLKGNEDFEGWMETTRLQISTQEHFRKLSATDGARSTVDLNIGVKHQGLAAKKFQGQIYNLAK